MHFNKKMKTRSPSW